MLKFITLSLCLVTLFCHASTLAIDAGNSVNGLDSNVTSVGLVPQARSASLYMNKKVFVVHFVRVSWISALEYCALQGQQLGSISSPEENERIINKLRQEGALYRDVKFWLGGYDIGHIGQWNWLANGRPFSYSNWKPGQPDNYGGLEHCLEMTYDGRWNDNNCDAANYVICENRCPLTSYDVPLYTK